MFLNPSAIMCAGSLAPGCRILGIFATTSQVYGAHGCHLACLVSLLWRPGGPWDDLGTMGSTTKDTLRSRLGFLRIFAKFRDPILRASWVPYRVFVHACFQASFFNDF